MATIPGAEQDSVHRSGCSPKAFPTTTAPPAPPAPAGALPFGASGNPADYGPAGSLPARTAYTGPATITTDGTIIADKNITGALHIAADHVTVRNVRFTAPSSWTWPQENNFIDVAPGFNDTLIEDVSFDGRDASGMPVVYDAVAGTGRITLRRCDVQRVGNAIEFGNGTVEDCYLHDIWQAGPQSEWHADGIQTDGGNGITVRNNYIAMGRPPAGYWSQTSAIGMWADAGELSNVLVTHNIVAPMGGFLFYDGVTNGTSHSVKNVSFVDNVVLRNGHQPDDYGVWYWSDHQQPLASRSGNVFDDGAPIADDE